MGTNQPIARFDTRTVLQVETRAAQNPRAKIQVQKVSFLTVLIVSCFSIIDTILEQKRELFKESAKMEQCQQRLRSYMTTE